MPFSSEHLHLFFFSFLPLQKYKINASINNNPNTTAKTIIAAKLARIVADIAAPIINPKTRVNAASNIITTIPRQFFLPSHLFSLLS